MADALLLALRLDTDRIEHRHRVLTAELAAENAGDREAAQRAAPVYADAE